MSADKPATARQAPAALEEADPRDARIQELERQLEQRRGGQPGQVMARVKVEPPHSELHYAGMVVGQDFTEVPQQQLGTLYEAAASAGVTLTQED